MCDVAKVSNDDENKETGEEEKMEEKNSTIVTPTKKLISGETLNEEDLKGRSKLHFVTFEVDLYLIICYIL